MSEIADALKSSAEKHIQQINGEWQKHKGLGESNIQFEITVDRIDRVEGVYRASGQGMWVMEYGKGSKLDRNNPFLSRYTSSPVFNRERENYEIRTRKGTYKDIDGNSHVGSGLGGKHGLNAEKFKKKKPLAMEPLYIIRDSLTKDSVLNQTLNDMLLMEFGATVKRELKV